MQLSSDSRKAKSCPPATGKAAAAAVAAAADAELTVSRTDLAAEPARPTRLDSTRPDSTAPLAATASSRSPRHPRHDARSAMPTGVVHDVSHAEEDFVYAALADGWRDDGRRLDQYLPAAFDFGQDWGTVQVTLGATVYVGRLPVSVSVSWL